MGGLQPVSVMHHLYFKVVVVFAKQLRELVALISSDGQDTLKFCFSLMFFYFDAMATKQYQRELS